MKITDWIYLIVIISIVVAFGLRVYPIVSEAETVTCTVYYRVVLYSVITPEIPVDPSLDGAVVFKNDTLYVYLNETGVRYLLDNLVATTELVVYAHTVNGYMSLAVDRPLDELRRVGYNREVFIETSSGRTYLAFPIELLKNLVPYQNLELIGCNVGVEP